MHLNRSLNFAWTLLTGFVVVCCASPVLAQQPTMTAQEYVESTSPLPNGGVVTSRATPSTRMHTITTIAQLPVRGAAPSSGSGQSVYRLPQGSAAPINANAASYPYPATSTPRRGILPGRRAYTGTQGRNYAVNQTSYQVPSLGITTNRTSQSCDTCATPQTSYQSGAAGQAPTLNFNVPGETQIGNGNFQTNPVQFQTDVGNPQYGNNGWWSPFVTGSGTYPSVVRFGNLPPGTYLGQGVVGQPTAYVDGQPVRNLFRYIFP